MRFSPKQGIVNDFAGYFGKFVIPTVENVVIFRIEILSRIRFGRRRHCSVFYLFFFKNLFAVFERYFVCVKRFGEFCVVDNFTRYRGKFFIPTLKRVSVLCVCGFGRIRFGRRGHCSVFYLFFFKNLVAVFERYFILVERFGEFCG